MSLYTYMHSWDEPLSAVLHKFIYHQPESREFTSLHIDILKNIKHDAEVHLNSS